MANEEDVQRLKQGVFAWNSWRREHPGYTPHFDWADLSNSDLSGAHLAAAHFVRANLSGANLSGAILGRALLTGANLSKANLSGAFLSGGDLTRTNLSGANLTGARLFETNLTTADLSGTDLTGADLSGATLVETNLETALLANCRVYGTGVWNIKLKNTRQSNLIITHEDEATITVDNIEVAQFIYLLINNAAIRDVIDTITSKAVLILGRFTDERMAVLEALRAELRLRGYLPILFDFEKPTSRDLTETVVTLANMSRFIIADITDARGIPQELTAIVPTLPSVPVKPIILRAEREWAMFEHLRRYPWMLDTFEYDNIAQLLASVADHIIAPAEAKANELKPKPLV